MLIHLSRAYKIVFMGYNTATKNYNFHGKFKIVLFLHVELTNQINKNNKGNKAELTLRGFSGEIPQLHLQVVPK